MTSLLSILFVGLSLQAQDIPSGEMVEATEPPSPKRWSLEIFGQNLSSSLNLRDQSREVALDPDPPSATGYGISYRGIGWAFVSDNKDEITRSTSSSFKWTIPWGRYFLEFYRNRISGMKVGNSTFRDDIQADNIGLIVTYAIEDDFSFSSLYGLEENMTGQGKVTTTRFWSGSLHENKWKGDSSFITNTTGPSDELGFRYLRQQLLTVRYGGVYIKYLKYLRFGALASVGGFTGIRTMRYDARDEIEETETGLALSLNLTVGSNLGFQRINKLHNIAAGYGLAIMTHGTSSFNSTSTGSSDATLIGYIGALF